MDVEPEENVANIRGEFDSLQALESAKGVLARVGNVKESVGWHLSAFDVPMILAGALLRGSLYTPPPLFRDPHRSGEWGKEPHPSSSLCSS